MAEVIVKKIMLFINYNSLEEADTVSTANVLTTPSPPTYYEMQSYF